MTTRITTPETAPRTQTRFCAACALLTLLVGAGCGLDGPLSKEAFAPTGPISIALDPLQDAYVDAPFEVWPVVRGGEAPFEWHALDLPEGLTVDPETGALYGSPKFEFDGEIVVKVTDKRSRTTAHKADFRVLKKPRIASNGLPPADLGTAYSATLLAKDGRAPYLWPSIQGLPQGLNYDQTEGRIFGTPEGEPGDYLISAQLVDANGLTARATLGLRILRPTENLSASVKLAGESTGDLVGWSVTGAGDVNQDGHNDLLIGAPGRLRLEGDTTSVLSARGGAYLAYGPIESNIKLLTSTTQILGESHGDNAGFTVSQGGDFDGDGTGDLLIGAPNASDSQPGAGAAYVIYGSIERGINLMEANLKILGEHEGDRAGASMTALGDINNDGFGDIAIGAPESDRNGVGTGSVFIFYGGSGLQGVRSTSDADAILNGAFEGDAAGFSLSNAGDINGDGHDDLLVGLRQSDDSGQSMGATSAAAYLIFGPVEGEHSLGDLGERGVTILHESDRDGEGYQVAAAGDLDGDGFDDIVIGGLLETTGRTVRAACVFYGAGLEGTVKLGDADARLIETQETLKLSVAGAGDINGDGIGDLVVGNPFADTEYPDAGRAYIVYGPVDGTQALSEASAAIFTGRDPYDRVGFSVASAGDLDGDGLADIAIGSPQGTGPGAVYLIKSGQR